MVQYIVPDFMGVGSGVRDGVLRHMGLDSICYMLSFIDCFYFGLMSSERKHPFYYIGLGLFLESSPMSGSVI